MTNRRFERYLYRQILVRMRQGDSDREIARSGIMGRKKVAQVREVAAARGWLAVESALPDEALLSAQFARHEALPASCISTLEPWREQISHWHGQGIQGTTIHAALVRNHGYTGSYSSVYRFLHQLELEAVPDVPLRLDFKPGEAAQIDFGAGPVITHALTGETFKTWFFVMTLCWSRHQYAEVVRDQSSATWLACHRHAFAWFNGVPGRLIIDNPKCAITRACFHDPAVQRAYAEYAEGYGFRIDPCPPRDPKKKGIVESGGKYVKRRFLPLRAFRSLADANRQLAAWVMGEAGNRCHGTTREKPLTRFSEVEKPLLRGLPDVPPELAVWARVKAHRDAHVQYGQCLYSVPFRLMGQSLWRKATDQLITVYRDHELIATHPRQTRPGARSTGQDHLPPEALAWNLQDTHGCLREAERIGPNCQELIQTLFADQVLVNLRAAQGVLRLEKTYGSQRLEAACSRAIRFGSVRYRTVKAILAKGLDQGVPSPASDTALADTYTHGGRFCRDTQTLLH